MTPPVNTNTLIFYNAENEIKPYDVSQVLSIKDGMVSDLKQNKLLKGMALNLKPKQVGYIIFDDGDVLEGLYLLKDRPLKQYVKCRLDKLIISDSFVYSQLVQFCIYPFFAFLGIFALISYLDFDNIFELSMLTGFLKTAQKVGSHANRGNITPQISRASYATYRVDDAKPSSTTHEQAQKNPILKKNNGDAFQHPAVVRTTCNLHDCEHKLCKGICGTPIEDADVGHVTHSGSYPGTVFVSNIDCSGKQQTEYLLPYNPPIENTSLNLNINQNKTTNLNDNPQALSNIHLNSSREPVQKTNIGSNDTTNIN